MPDLNLADFLAACEARGPMSLRDHFASTSTDDIPDLVAERKLRGAVWTALKAAKWSHLAEIILRDRGSEAVRSNLPVVARPDSLEVVSLEEIQATNNFRLPSVAKKLADATRIVARHPSRASQQTIQSAIVALNDERILEKAKLEAAELRMEDKTQQLEEARRDKIWMQTEMANGRGGSGGNNGGKSLTK